MYDFIQLTWIPLVMGAVVMFVAVRVLVFKDISWLRNKFKPDPKDMEGYCKAAGKILIFFGACAFVMAFLETISPEAALMEITICTMVTLVLWKRMNDKYE